MDGFTPAARRLAISVSLAKEKSPETVALNADVMVAKSMTNCGSHLLEKPWMSAAANTLPQLEMSASETCWGSDRYVS